MQLHVYTDAEKIELELRLFAFEGNQHIHLEIKDQVTDEKTKFLINIEDALKISNELKNHVKTLRNYGR